ncbi:MAG: hypothetical protein JNK46_05365 [Methylobacteriaceae bacterium]|nr:hypothetical protein [Methylobacteriaceae bacterium]
MIRTRQTGRKGAAALALAALLFAAHDARAQEARTDSIDISYEAPSDPSHRAIYEAIRDKRVLESFQRAYAPFRLPRRLLAKTAGCNGDINASYEAGVIVICYEYLQYVAEIAASRRRPSDLPESAALAGPVLDVFFHEAAHAVFEYLRTPIFGREEDAADQMSALAILHLGGDDSAALIRGIAFMYLEEAGVSGKRLSRPRLRFVRPTSFADEHSTPLQRKFNILCLAYGSDAKKFARLVAEGALPKERAELCEGEYAQAVHAFRSLILPHLDRPLAQATYGPIQMLRAGP